jgi:hypothetical protein
LSRFPASTTPERSFRCVQLTWRVFKNYTVRVTDRLSFDDGQSQRQIQIDLQRAVAGEEEWPVRVRTGVSEALRLLAANPAIAHLIAVEALQAGPAARERQQARLAGFAEALRAGRSARPGLPAELEELLLGGVLSLIARYVDSGRAEHLPEATPELVQYLRLRRAQHNTSSVRRTR